jgi:hypothetical protein
VSNEQATDSQLWGFSGSQDSERLHGPHDSRDEAIAAGRAYFGADQPVYVWPCAYPGPAEFVPSASDIIERMGEAAGDNYGEIAADFPEVTDDGKVALDALLEAWADKHVTNSFWVAIGDPERIDPARVEPIQ